jgi:hypothetical protein
LLTALEDQPDIRAGAADIQGEGPRRAGKFGIVAPADDAAGEARDQELCRTALRLRSARR